MIVSNVTKIKIGLNAEERDILKKAIQILREVNAVIDSETIDYVTYKDDMNLFDEVFDEINRIESYIIIE